MRGTVVTFYSYKGGVGRSFALANVAALLGRWGFRVLCIDWDLEAPGLEDFFRPYSQDHDLSDRDGLVELLLGFSKRAQVPLLWRDLVIPLDARQLPGVDLIKSGRADEGYTRRLQQINWERLYKRGLGDALETMFDEVRGIYDFILIDSRTGVTDFSGIVTAQLPDVLAFLFTANEQSISGATMVAKRAAIIRNDIALDRSPLLMLPIPARFEAQVEHRISQQWRERFVAQLSDFYSGWASEDARPEKLVPATTIPYVPFWSFGEKLSVVEDPISSPSGINYALENLAALIAHKLSKTQLLIESRDEFIGAARRIGRDSDKISLFLSFSAEHRPIANSLRSELVRNAIDVKFLDPIEAGGARAQTSSVALEGVDHFVLLFGPNDDRNRSFEPEIRAFLRQSASDERPRLLVPFTIGNVDPERLPSYLQHLRSYVLSEEDIGKASRQILKLINRPELPTAVGQTDVRVRISGEGNRAIADAMISAVADNGTTIDAASDKEGYATVPVLASHAYRLLVAHPEYRPQIIMGFNVSELLEVRLEKRGDVGSTIIQSSGHINGLNGALNPILDTSDRTYMYADNIAIDGGKKQPTSFSVDEPLILEDAQGNVFRTIVRFIEGRTALIEYERVASQLEKLVSIRNKIDRALRKLADQAVMNGADAKSFSRSLPSRQLAELVVRTDVRLSPYLPMLVDFWKVANAAIHGQNVTIRAMDEAIDLGRQILQILNAY